GSYALFIQAEDGIRGRNVTGVQTCARPILGRNERRSSAACIAVGPELLDAGIRFRKPVAVRDRLLGLERQGNAGAWIFLEIIERSEEHTSELQSRFDLVCRLLLEKHETTIC